MPPNYSVRPSIKRAIIPHAFQTAFLCILFYAAVEINLRLFVSYRLLSSPPSYVLIAIAGVLCLLFIIEMLNTYRRYVLTVYTFYPDRIEVYGRKTTTVSLASVVTISLKKNILDAPFRTGSLVFLPAFRLDHLENPEQFLGYVQGLVSQARSTQLPPQYTLSRPYQPYQPQQ